MSPYNWRLSGHHTLYAGRLLTIKLVTLKIKVVQNTLQNRPLTPAMNTACHLLPTCNVPSLSRQRMFKNELTELLHYTVCHAGPAADMSIPSSWIYFYVQLRFKGSVILSCLTCVPITYHPIKHKTLNQQTHYYYYYYYYYLDTIYYNPCKPVQHLSIPSWDHHQGHL
jgi:hypothetical protein